MTTRHLVLSSFPFLGSTGLLHHGGEKRMPAYGSIQAEEGGTMLPQSSHHHAQPPHNARGYSFRALVLSNLASALVAAAAGALVVAVMAGARGGGGGTQRMASPPSSDGQVVVLPTLPAQAMSLPMQVRNDAEANVVGSDQWRLDNCPWGKVELGRGGWPLLHSLAAEYPDEPTQELQILAYTFIEALGQLYPCHLCARHFRAAIQVNPPRVESRQALSEWFCEQHNEVNGRQHKPLFNCSIESLDLRWKTGVAQCWDKDHPFEEPGNE